MRYNWVQWATLAIMVVALWALASCATSPLVQPEWTYTFCKAGIGGDWRIGTQIDRSTGEETPILFLFSVGGPYDKAHVLCAISGDHAILDLGRGKGL